MSRSLVLALPVLAAVMLLICGEVSPGEVRATQAGQGSDVARRRGRQVIRERGHEARPIGQGDRPTEDGPSGDE